jgi:multidrug efflux pump subunit AcrB
MVFFALLLLGIYAYKQIPVSLLPKIDINEIIVIINYDKLSSRDLEKKIVSPIKQKLQQVTKLKNFSSETYDGYSRIEISFDYGTDIEYANIEVNEKIDQAMRSLPRDLERPIVLKVSATDLPALNLNIRLKNNGLSKGVSDINNFLPLSEFCNTVIKQRVEQLTEVAMVDVSGLAESQLEIIPNQPLMKNLGLSNNDIIQILKEQEIGNSSSVFSDGHLEFPLILSGTITSIDDLKNVLIKIDDRLFQLKDIAQIKEKPKIETGGFFVNSNRAISLAIIKQSDSKVKDFRDNLLDLVNEFENDYPELSFEIAQDQTSILFYALSNLRNSLILGVVISIIIMFFFIRNIQSPLIIGVILPVSILISLLFFFLLNISINIISLSGLILCVGLMIDNSIIVIENISQYQEKNNTIFDSCILGTNEVVRPILSSALTTCAVFVPLIFISGLAGALFFDQAIAISIGLFVSFAVSITLIPVLYFKFNSKTDRNFQQGFIRSDTSLLRIYESGFNKVFQRKKVFLSIFLFVSIFSAIAYLFVNKERLPNTSQNEFEIKINWGKNVSYSENVRTTFALISQLNEEYDLNVWCGKQQYLLNNAYNVNESGSLIYVKSDRQLEKIRLTNIINNYLEENDIRANFDISPAENIFERIFSNDIPNLIACIRNTKKHPVDPENLIKLKQAIESSIPAKINCPIPIKDVIDIKINMEKAMVYNIDYTTIKKAIIGGFQDQNIGVFQTGVGSKLILLKHELNSTRELLSSNFTIENRLGEKIPLNYIIEFEPNTDFKYIISDKAGEYLPIYLEFDKNHMEKVKSVIKQIIVNEGNLDINYKGALLDNIKLFDDLKFVLLISLTLLYFILAAQFESILQPIIVLLEIPINIFGSLIFIIIFGESLNIMSAIGIIVMSGITINDSILKVDTINRELKKTGKLMESIKLAGAKRLRPILMTSLTTILSLAPLLFGSDIGSGLQKPLALAIIGGMTVGTFASIYFIPLFYYLLFKRKVSN